MITDPESLSDIFNVFHDGKIIHHEISGTELILHIRVKYLAELVNPNYRIFRVSLQNTRNIEFKTWPKGLAVEPVVLDLPGQIFLPELEILSGELVGDAVKVICNQASPACDYCGGELFFKADSAVVLDEGGKKYTIEELHDLGEQYWSAWEGRNAKVSNI